MRDIRSGQAGRAEVGRAEKQLARYLRKQPGGSLRGIPAPKKPGRAKPYVTTPIEAKLRYLRARARAPRP
jgi:hypothetical protein